MTESEAVQIARAHFESQFPRTCSNCGRGFPTLRDYIATTTRAGAAQSIDAEFGAWETRSPIGSLALVNCPCGSTLALGTDGMAMPERLALLQWVKEQTEHEGISASQLLERLRDAIRAQVRAEASRETAP